MMQSQFFALGTTSNLRSAERGAYPISLMNKFSLIRSVNGRCRVTQAQIRVHTESTIEDKVTPRHPAGTTPRGGGRSLPNFIGTVPLNSVAQRAAEVN